MGRLKVFLPPCTKHKNTHTQIDTQTQQYIQPRKSWTTKYVISFFYGFLFKLQILLSYCLRIKNSKRKSANYSPCFKHLLRSLFPNKFIVPHPPLLLYACLLGGTAITPMIHTAGDHVKTLSLLLLWISTRKGQCYSLRCSIHMYIRIQIYTSYVWWLKNYDMKHPEMISHFN